MFPKFQSNADEETKVTELSSFAEMQVSLVPYIDQQKLGNALFWLLHGCGKYLQENHQSFWRSVRHRTGIREVYKFQDEVQTAQEDLSGENRDLPGIVTRMNQALIFLNLERERNYSRRAHFTHGAELFKEATGKGSISVSVGDELKRQELELGLAGQSSPVGV